MPSSSLSARRVSKTAKPLKLGSRDSITADQQSTPIPLTVAYNESSTSQRNGQHISVRDRGRDHLPSTTKQGSDTLRGCYLEGENLLVQHNTSGPSMFGDNVLVQGGQFFATKKVVINKDNARPIQERAGFKTLLLRVSPSAFHDSAQLVDPPRCHAETRIEILQRIYDWILQSEDRKTWLLWLNGAAGAGKFAIMQSIAERCAKAGITIASFFFFRSDPTRNSMASVIATLVYQLIDQIPETANEILTAIECNPLIFEQSLKSQLEKLVLNPLLHISGTSRRKQFAILIDGLDECLDRQRQTNLIKVLAEVSENKHIPVVFIIASRREPQIQSMFDTRKVAYLLDVVPLDDNKALDDIRRFLNAGFADLKTTHLWRHLIPANWPSISIVSQIVKKSSNQFIFASVVMNYISSSRGNPVRRLGIINDLRLHDPSSEHPFSHLDTVYRHILSQVEGLEKVMDILAYALIAPATFIRDIEGLFGVDTGELQILFADLASVIEFEPYYTRDPELKFLHASFPDFLLDKSRSDMYFIDQDAYCNKLLCQFLERPQLDLKELSWDFTAGQEFYRLYAIGNLLEQAKPSERLRRAMMDFRSTFHCFKVDNVNGNTEDRITILRSLKKLDFRDDGQAYRHVLNMFAEGYSKFWPIFSSDVKEIVRSSSDLCSCICQFRPALQRRLSLEPREPEEHPQYKKLSTAERITMRLLGL